MLSQIPFDLSVIPKEDIDKQLLRVGMIAEIDAVSLYEQMSEMTTDSTIKKAMLSIAKEEKTHIGEFQALLLERDTEQVAELKAGVKEVKDFNAPTPIPKEIVEEVKGKLNTTSVLLIAGASALAFMIGLGIGRWQGRNQPYQ